MAQTYSSILLHVIFSTKNRERTLRDPLRSQVHAYLAGILKQNECNDILVDGVEDHVHLFFSAPPKLALSDLIRDVKSCSSGFVRDTDPALGFGGWQRGFAAFSVSESQRPAVEAYIRNQEAHHRTISFGDELRKFLRAHGVKFDENYLLD